MLLKSKDRPKLDGLPVPSVVGEDVPFYQLTMPSFDSLDDPELFGYKPPSAAQRAKDAEILLENSPGMTPAHNGGYELTAGG